MEQFVDDKDNSDKMEVDQAPSESTGCTTSTDDRKSVLTMANVAQLPTAPKAAGAKAPAAKAKSNSSSSSSSKLSGLFGIRRKVKRRQKADRSKSGDYERLHPDPEISELCRAQLTWYVLRRKRRKERKRKQKLAKRKKRAAAKAAKAKAAGEAVGANGGAKNRLSLFAERMRALGKKVKESSSNGGDQKEDSEESELSSSSVSSQSGAEATMRAELRLLGILKGGGKPVDKKKKGKNCSSGSSSSSSSSVSSKSSTSTTLSQFKLKNGPRIDKVPLCRFCTNTSGRGSCAAVPEDNLEHSPPAGATSAAAPATAAAAPTDKSTAANKKPPKNVKKAKAKKPKPGCDPQTGKEIGILKPDGIYFGETLESKVLKKAIQTALHSEVVLLVGTTGKVDPARQMPIMAKLHNRAKVIECNPNRTLLSKTADLDLREPSARCLPRLVEYVRVMGDVLGYGNHGGSSSSASSVSGGGAGEPGKAGAASSAFSSAVSSAEGGGSQGPRATAKGRVVVG